MLRPFWRHEASSTRTAADGRTPARSRARAEARQSPRHRDTAGSTPGYSDTCPGRRAGPCRARSRPSRDTRGTPSESHRRLRPVEIEREQPTARAKDASDLVEGVFEDGNVPQAVAGGHEIDAGVGKRQRRHVADEERRNRPHALMPRATRLRARDLHHAGRDVEPDHGRAARRRFERDVAGAAREIECAVAVLNRASRTSRRFQRESCPYDSTIVMKS